MKIWQILHVLFESTSKFSFKFYINLQCHQTYITPLYFFSSNIKYFSQQQPIKVNIFEVSCAQIKIHQISHVNFELTGQCLFKFCIIQIFASFIIMIHKSIINFKLIHFLLWIKEFHQTPNFETFECSCENLLTSSCHFWKNKSVFLQILHQISVPQNLTLLCFLSLNIIYFGQKQPIKVQIFEIFECSRQNSSNSLC